MIERLEQASGRDVSRQTFDKLSAYAALLISANREQNLVSSKSIDELWERHIVDAAQLLRLAPGKGHWCDIGSGAGLPGIVLAILGAKPMTLVEPRKLRAQFLESAVASLGLQGVRVMQCPIGAITSRFDVVTARAVAPLAKLLTMAEHVTHRGTVWLLPKGRGAQSELDEARLTWQGDFELVPSLTSDEGSILVARRVSRRG
jgi:16S rRNA (guanine527-N7)-methyltransferase